MKGDLFLLLNWWFYILLLGLLFLPVVQYFTGRFFDRGYLFSKVLAILTTAYTIWLISFTRLLPFSRTTILVLLAGFAYYVFIQQKGWERFKTLFQKNKQVFLLCEALFLVALVAWSYLRGIQPNIYGLEKFMDYGFVNSILRTDFMPPADMWFAGESINYYYFGQYLTAFLIKLTDIHPAVGYNLMVATLFAFGFSLTFSVAANLIYMVGRQNGMKILFGGFSAALLMCLGGNLHTLIYAHLLPWAKKLNLYDGPLMEPYWYAEATRFIGYNPPTNDKTIHEFPFYSFVISDLHAHVLNVPVVLALLTVIMYLFFSSPTIQCNHIRPFSMSPGLLLLAFLLGICLMTNTWDYPIYFGLAGLVVLYKNLSVKELRWPKTFLHTLVQGVQVVIVSFLVTLPFLLHFENFSKGVDWVEARSPIYQLLVLWGYQVFFLVSFLLVLVWLAIRFIRQNRESGGLDKVLPQFIASRPPSDILALLVAITALLFVILPEIVYVRDIYGLTYHRANTMFKLTFQAYILFAVAVGYIAVMAGSYLRRINTTGFIVYSLLAAIMLVSPLLYTPWGLQGYYGSITPENYKGLNGERFLADISQDDFEALQWMKRNITGQPVVLEAHGDSYTIHNRFSALTGLPTVLGWFVHVWLHRGTPEIASGRVNEVNLLYESDDMAETLRLVRKYNIQYIVIGSVEKERFKNLNEDKLLKLGTIVFENPGTKIIQVQE